MQHDFLIGTVRFNNKTYLENLKWKQRKGHNGCAYGLDKPLSKNIYYCYVFHLKSFFNI